MRSIRMERDAVEQKTQRLTSCPSAYSPKTLSLARKPKYPRKSVHHVPRMDAFRTIVHPLNTESAMKKIEDNNTLVFVVDIKANKRQIKEAVKKLYDVKADKINTLIRPDGKKKAFVRLDKSLDALEVANKVRLLASLRLRTAPDAQRPPDWLHLNSPRTTIPIPHSTHSIFSGQADGAGWDRAAGRFFAGGSIGGCRQSIWFVCPSICVGVVEGLAGDGGDSRELTVGPLSREVARWLGTPRL